MPKKIFIIIILGLIIRLAVMPFTSHPDLRGHYLGAYFISQKGQLLGVYDYLSRLPRDHPYVLLYHDDFLVYSPLTYQLHAAWMSLVSPLIPWSTFERMEIDMTAAQSAPDFPWLVFILKFPYLLADLICLWLLIKLVSIKNKTLAVTLWAVNLPVIHSSFLMGQFDVFILLSLLGALALAERKKPELASLVLGLGAGFKPFSLFLIPLLPGSQIRNLLIGGGTYLLMILPYALLSPGFRMYALVAQHSDKLWYAKVLVSGSQYLPLFFVVLFVTAWLRRLYPKAFSTLIWFTLPLLGFYSLVNFHPQWFTWISGFLILILVRTRASWQLVTTLLVCWLIITFSFESSLTFGLFNLNYSLKPFLNDQLISAVRGIIAATSIALVVKLKASETS